MSTVKQPQPSITVAEEPLTEDSICDYLQSHPDFFENHQSLLGNLKLPHSTGGPAVSLVERQVAVLRQQNLKLERKLKELLEVARGNDQLAEKIHAMAVELLVAPGRDEIVTLLEKQLRTAFSADRSVLVLFESGAESVNDTGFLRLIDRENSEISPFKLFMQSTAPRCGRVRDAQRDYLFGADDVEIGSVALVPLGEKCELGFIAIGSRNADHFHPGKSIDFLARLGELLTASLRNQ
jgi:uncharacterized protein YigA (DUF484 family)